MVRDLSGKDGCSVMAIKNVDLFAGFTIDSSSNHEPDHLIPVSQLPFFVPTSMLPNHNYFTCLFCFVSFSSLQIAVGRNDALLYKCAWFQGTLFGVHRGYSDNNNIKIKVCLLNFVINSFTPVFL